MWLCGEFPATHDAPVASSSARHGEHSDMKLKNKMTQVYTATRSMLLKLSTQAIRTNGIVSRCVYIRNDGSLSKQCFPQVGVYGVFNEDIVGDTVVDLSNSVNARLALHAIPRAPT